MSRATMLFAVLALGCLYSGAFATDYFVATDGDNGNPGTIDYPWATIQYATTQVGPGDTINVRAGTYPDHVWTEFLDGTSGAYITIQSYDGDLAAAITDYVSFYACHYVNFIGFEVSGGTNTLHIMPTEDLVTRSGYINVQRCYIHTQSGNGDVIKVNQSDYINIEDCEVADNSGGDQLVDFVWVNYSEVRNCYLRDFEGRGWYNKGGSLYNVVDGCAISHALDDVTPCTAFGGTTDRKYRNPDSLYASEYCVIRNSIMRDATKAANGTYDCWYAYFYHNTVHDCGGPGDWGGIIVQHTNRGTPINGWSRHMFYFNNVFLDTDGDMGCVYEDENGKYEDWNTGNNNYYNAGNPISSVGIVDPNEEAGATFGDPNLANPTGSATTYAGWLDCYRITASSTALIDQGNSSAGDDPQPAVHYDIEGTARPQGSGYDIGAFEYVGGPVAPTAEFSGNPTEGPPTLTVCFTDLSTGSPTSWDWTFGDGGTSQAEDPSHDYTAVDTYTVALTVENAQGQDTETKVDYITVVDQSCHVGAIDLVGEYKSTGPPSGRGYYAEATITVHDQDCQPLSGVTVDITWSGCVSGSDSDVTDGNGQVTFSSPVNPDGGTFQCCVDDLTKSGYPYQPGDNHETCDSITNP